MTSGKPPFFRQSRSDSRVEAKSEPLDFCLCARGLISIARPRPMRSRSLCEDGGKRFAAPAITVCGMSVFCGWRTCTPSITRSPDAACGRAWGNMPLGTLFPSFLMRQNKQQHASRKGNTSSRYTAGPWDHYDYQDPNYPTIKIEDDHGDPIAYVVRSDRGSAESLANARLISVAPELLEILKKAGDRCKRLPEDSATEELAYAIENVISKAEGRDL